MPNDYDPLLSKLIAWGNSREEAISRLRRALQEYSITGIKTNIGLFYRILSEPEFIRGEIHTKWLDQMLSRPHQNITENDTGETDAAAIAAALWQANQTSANSCPSANADTSTQSSRWKNEGRSQQLDRRP